MRVKEEMHWGEKVNAMLIYDLECMILVEKFQENVFKNAKFSCNTPENTSNYYNTGSTYFRTSLQFFKTFLICD